MMQQSVDSLHSRLLTSTVCAFDVTQSAVPNRERQRPSGKGLVLLSIRR